MTFTPDGWERLDRAAERIVEMDAFAEASTIADADFIESIDEMLVVEPYRGAVESNQVVERTPKNCPRRPVSTGQSRLR